MNADYPRKGLRNTEERVLTCRTLGRDYHLSVALPESYATSGQNYPVMYLLDSDLFFGVAANLTPLLQGMGKPELIVVGIGYDMESMDQWFHLREIDLKIPEVADAPADSRAGLFLNALSQEIIPFIEANYRVSPSDRALYGYSSGGFFVLYALFHQPGAFHRYIAGSGDLYLAYPYLIQHTDQLANRTSTDPIQLYLSAGELEEHQFPYFRQLLDFLERASYPGLAVQAEIFPGAFHGPQGIALTYLHGIQQLYPDVGPRSSFLLG